MFLENDECQDQLIEIADYYGKGSLKNDFNPFRPDYFLGIDLHKDSMSVCIHDRHGQVVFGPNTHETTPKSLKQILAKFPNSAVGVEDCPFWYWVHNVCLKEKINLQIVRLNENLKNKSDKVDAKNISKSLMAGGFKVNPAISSREIRDIQTLVRTRADLVGDQTTIINRISGTANQHNIKLPNLRNANVQVEFPDHLSAHIKLKLNFELDRLSHLKKDITALESEILKYTKAYRPGTLDFLKQIPGIGDILAVTILYESDPVERFESAKHFCSYCGLVPAQRESGGKSFRSQKDQRRNPTLNWAIHLATDLAVQHEPRLRLELAKLSKKHGKKHALRRLANKLGRAVFYALTEERRFDMNKFLAP